MFRIALLTPATLLILILTLTRGYGREPFNRPEAWLNAMEYGSNRIV